MVKHLTRGVYIDTVAQVVCWVSAACQESVHETSQSSFYHPKSFHLQPQ